MHYIFYAFLLPVLEKSTLGSSHLKTPAKSQNLLRLLAVVQNLTVNSMTPLQISIMFAMYLEFLLCNKNLRSEFRFSKLSNVNQIQHPIMTPCFPILIGSVSVSCCFLIAMINVYGHYLPLKDFDVYQILMVTRGRGGLIGYVG